MNKTELFESIMKNVAKEVKKALNEDSNFDDHFNDQVEEMQIFIKLLDLCGITSKAADEVKKQFSAEAKKYFIAREKDSYKPSDDYENAIENIKNIDQMAELYKLLIFILQKTSVHLNIKEVNDIKEVAEKKINEIYAELGKTEYQHQKHNKLKDLEELVSKNEYNEEDMLKKLYHQLLRLKVNMATAELLQLEKEIIAKYKK